MARRGEQGHILVHVLITAVVIAIISAGISRMLLTRAYLQARATEGAQNHRADTGGVNRVLTAWAANNTVCSDPGTAIGYVCSGGAGAPYGVAPGTADCKCCPTDTTKDAAMTFSGGKLCVETPSSAGTYTADTSGGGSCPNITCP